MNGDFDPVETEILKNALESLVDEMAMTILRTAYSNNLKNSMDFSTALCQSSGELIAQGLTLPLHLGSVPHAMQSIFATFGDDIRPGDIYLLNDPYAGGTHLPDFYIFKPVFLDGVLACYLVTIAHHADVGGMVAGGNGCDATEIFQEGIRIPPLKLYDAGVPNESVFKLIRANVRVPRLVLGDIRAQLSACHVGERRVTPLFGRYGHEELQARFSALLDYTERLARQAIAELPDGEYAFTDYIDDDGFDPGPIPIAVTVRVHGDSMTVDFTGTSPQVRGGINSPIPFTRSAVYACVRSLMGEEIPNNEGYFRPIEVIAPKSSVVNPSMPAPVAARGLTGYRTANAVMGALAKLAPERIPACEVGGDTGVSIGGYDDDGNPFVYLEFLFGSWGGKPWSDGTDAMASIVVNFSNNPVEVVEAELPLRIERYGYVPDSEGAGKFRGGLALVRDYRLRERRATLQLRSDRHKTVAYGLAGGLPGAHSQNILNPDTEARVLTSKATETIYENDLFRHMVSGAGGWGNPLERDPQLVLDDVQNEKVTRERAQAVYGVVVTPAGELDTEATEHCRAACSGDPAGG